MNMSILGIRTSVILAVSLLLSILVAANPLKAELTVRERHIILLYPGLDSLWGNYIFMLSNTGDEAVQHRMPLLMPQETVDWQAGQGIAPAEIKLQDGGGLVLDKAVPPGNHLMSLGFKLAASGGSTSFTLKPGIDMDMLGVFLPQDSELVMTGGDYRKEENFPFSGKVYDAYTILGAEAGREISSSVAGIPEGRGEYWILGWILTAVLLLVAGVASYLTRPKLDGDPMTEIA